MGAMVLEHGMIARAVGEKNSAGILKNYEKHKELYVEFSAYNHLDKNDPPLLMVYGGLSELPATSSGKAFIMQNSD